MEVRERPTETGTLRLSLTDKPGAEVTEFSAQLVSDWGELISMNGPAQALSLPVGRYRVDALTFQMGEANSRKWLYRFAGGPSFDMVVSPGKPTIAPLLRGLKLGVEIDVGKAGVRPGADVAVTPTLRTPAGTYLVNCQSCERGREDFTSMESEILLFNARGETLCKEKTGLMWRTVLHALRASAYRRSWAIGRGCHLRQWPTGRPPRGAAGAVGELAGGQFDQIITMKLLKILHTL